jgi:hypothetical protein
MEKATAKPADVILKCKCVCCAGIHELRKGDIDPAYGPYCPDCLGPMVLLEVEAKGPDDDI